MMPERMVRAVLLLGLVADVASVDAGVLGVGQPAVELDVAVDAAGKPFKLAAYRGRWLVLAVGAAWCGPCQDELVTWNKLAGELAGRVTFVTLAIDSDIADGKAFHARLGVRNLVRAYLPEERSQIAERYGSTRLPSTFVIGPDGIVRHVQPGFDKALAQQEYARLKAVLGKLIPPPPARPGKPPPARPSPEPPPPPRPAVAPVPPLVLPDQPHVAWWADRWPALPF